LTFQGKVLSDEEWYLHQTIFLKSHNYYTKSAHILRDAGKEKNLRKLEMLLEKKSGPQRRKNRKV
jgi:hypothetical protein